MKRLVLTVYAFLVAVLAVTYSLRLCHRGSAVLAQSESTDKPPVVLFVDRGPGKYYTYHLDGKSGDPLRLCGDALEKYGRNRQVFIVVDSRLPIDTFAETELFSGKAGFPRENVRYFENYRDGTMSEITWGLPVHVPGDWKPQP